MATDTNIEWCDSTFNPWIGCAKISPGCDHCYAERSTPARTMGIVWGPGQARRLTSDDNWRKPRQWDKAHAKFFAQHGRRRRVFCASLADIFDNQVPEEFRCRLWRLIAETPHLDWLLLTKRIGNALDMLPAYWCTGPLSLQGWWQEFKHVSIGISVVNQAEADRDIQKLFDVPVNRRFLSMEPLLGPVDLRSVKYAPGCNVNVLSRPGDRLDWVIVGGESGPGARPMHPAWVRSLRDQCAAEGVPFFFKQWGEWAHVGASGAGSAGEIHKMDDHCWVWRVGKKAAGCRLDGIEHKAWPEDDC